MTLNRGWLGIVVVATLVCGAPLAAQETAIKGAIAKSKFSAGGTVPNVWDDPVTTTGFGFHVRFHFGRVALQPELQVVTRGGKQSVTDSEDEQLRLEYLELPVLLVLPVRIGELEPYAFGGGMLALEIRCKWIVKESGLRSTFGCDNPDAFEVPDRNSIDYGVVAGAGVSYPIGSGRLLFEARHTWGLRNIVGAPAGLELRHRTIAVGIGYTIPIQEDGR
jgi:hypothetical protein